MWTDVVVWAFLWNLVFHKAKLCSLNWWQWRYLVGKNEMILVLNQTLVVVRTENSFRKHLFLMKIKYITIHCFYSRAIERNRVVRIKLCETIHVFSKNIILMYPAFFLKQKMFDWSLYSHYNTNWQAFFWDNERALELEFDLPYAFLVSSWNLNLAFNFQKIHAPVIASAWQSEWSQ